MLAIDSARCSAQYDQSDLDTPGGTHSRTGEVEILGAEDNGDDQRIVVKKYANRRLYNTATSSYVTLDHLARLTQEGVDFVVYDAKSGEDITRSVLTQIIVEEEAKGENLLPIAFLRQLITFYGDNMRWMVPQYLEHMIQSFAENQDRMRGAMQDAMGNLFPFGNLEDMRKQNMAFFEQAMRVWSPFAAGQGTGQAAGGPAAGTRPASRPAAPAPAVDPSELAAAKARAIQDQADLVRLKAEVESLRAELQEKAKALEPTATPTTMPAGAPLGKDTANPPEPANNPGAQTPVTEARPSTPVPEKPAAATGRRAAAKAPATKPPAVKAPAAKAPAAKTTGRTAPAKAAASKPPAAKRGRPAGSTRARAAKAAPAKPADANQPAKTPDAKKN